MTDIIRTQGEALPKSMQTAWRDMGDGTHALERATKPIVDGEPVSESNPLPVGDIWSVTVLTDKEDNDIDKAFVVPVGYEYQILGVRVEYNAEGAIAGDRQIAVEWQDDTGQAIGEVRAGATLAQSETGIFSFAPSLADLLSFRDTTWLMTPLPPTIFLSAGYAIRVHETGITDATDNMHVFVHLARRAT